VFFRINNRRILLEYDKVLDKSFEESMKKKFSKYKDLQILKFETKVSKYLIDFGKPMQTKKIDKFDYQGSRPEITLIKSSKEWKDTIEKFEHEENEHQILEEKNDCVFYYFDEKNIDRVKQRIKKYVSSLKGIAKVEIQGTNTLKIIAGRNTKAIELFQFLSDIAGLGD